MNSFFKRMFLLLMFFCIILVFPHKVLPAVSILWSTTFDCDEWLHTGGPEPDCDDLRYASDKRTGTQITTAANYPGGGGGRGLRQYLGDGTNNQTSGLRFSFPASDEIWIRWYMRYESGFKWTGNWPGYDKWLYIDSGQSDCCIPEWDGDEVNLHSCISGNNKNDNAHWQMIMGGTTGDGEWHCYEIHVKQAGSNGIGEMWIDGVRYLNWTNTNYGSGSFTTCVIGSNCMTPNNGSSGSAREGTLTNAGYVDFDDVVISNTGYIGPIGSGSSDSSPPSPPVGVIIVQ